MTIEESIKYGKYYEEYVKWFLSYYGLYPAPDTLGEICDAREGKPSIAVLREGKDYSVLTLVEYGVKKEQEERYGIGKYFYDVFYKELGEDFTGTIKGDNKEYARKNFYEKYGTGVKIKHLQRLSYK